LLELEKYILQTRQKTGQKKLVKTGALKKLRDNTSQKKSNLPSAAEKKGKRPPKKRRKNQDRGKSRWYRNNQKVDSAPMREGKER